MTDLSQLSNEELTALYRQSQSPDIGAMVTAAAQRHNVNPDLALRVARQESGLRADAVSPKGARGPMQLMPATARELGVDPNDPAQNIDGGVRYLAQQLQAFNGDERLALAAYNAGPGAVRKYGGVPPYAETQNYVRSIAGGEGGDELSSGGGDLSSLSDEELKALYAQSAPQAAPQPQGRIVERAKGITVELGGSEDVQPGWTEYKPEVPSVLEDAASGFAQPFRELGHTVMESYRRKTAELDSPPPSLAEAATRSVQGLADIPRIASAALGVTGAPLQAVVRPAARALNNAGERVGLRPHTQDSPLSAPRALRGEEAQAAIEGILNTALQGARPRGLDLPAAQAASAAQTAIPGRNLTQQVRAVTPQMPGPAIRPQPMTLDQLKRADDAAWAKVDASGYRFPRPDVKAVAADVRTLVNDAGPELYPESAKIAARIDALAKRNDLTPAQANRLRSQVGEKLLQPGSTEASVGAAIKARIDALIDTANDPNLAAARELHTRFRKVEEVTNRIDSGDLRAATTYAGGNKANAVRQNLRPLIDPKSKQRMRNLTPAEKKALNRAVRGSAGANAARVTGKLLDPRGLLGIIAQSAGAPLTGGASLAAAAPGVLASELSNHLTLKAVDDLLALMSSGGKASRSLPKITPRGLIGGSVLAAPAARQEDLRQSERKASRRGN